MSVHVNLPDGRTVDVNDLGGLADVAEHYGWPISTMTTWVNRYTEIPTPVVVLRRGPIYVISDWAGFTPPGSTKKQKVA